MDKNFNRFFKGCFNKLTFKTRKKAEDFAEHQWKKYGAKLKMYTCDFCLDYHLTSQK